MLYCGNSSVSFFKPLNIILSILLFTMPMTGIGDVYWQVNDPATPEGWFGHYGSAAEACEVGKQLKEAWNADIEGMEWRNAPGQPFYFGGPYIDRNYGKQPGDPDFAPSYREISCNHEYRCKNCGGWAPEDWATYWPYSGAAVQIAGDSCPQGQWDTETLSCGVKGSENAGDCKSGGCPGSDQGPRLGAGNPIHVVTGNKYQGDTDFISPTLSIRRSYNSLYDSWSTLGNQWRHNYSQKIIIISDTVVQVYRSDGRVYRYEEVAGIWQSSDREGTLSKVNDKWFYTNKNNTVETFDIRGRLTRIQYLNGSTLTITHGGNRQIESIKDDRGDELRFSYNSNYKVDQIAIPGNRVIKYQYTDDNLTAVIYPDATVSDDSDNPRKIYHYENPSNSRLLTGITDENGFRYATFEYGSDGKATASYHAGNAERVDVAYNADGSRTLTNSRGYQSTYQTAYYNGYARVISVSGPGCVTCGIGSAVYSYAPDTANLLSMTEKGVTTDFGGYDTNGNYGYKIIAAGTPEEKRVDYTYDPRFRNKVSKITESSVISGQQKVTTYSYDNFGNRTAVTISGFAPDLQGGFVPVSTTTTFTYQGPLNQLSQIDGPRTDVSDVTLLNYYANDPLEGNNRARLKQMVGPENLVLRDNIQYTATGKVASESRPNGVTISYSYYPGSDRLESVTESDGINSRTTRWTYLASGEVQTITQGYNSSLSTTIRLEYDNARRLVGIIDDLGNTIEYTLDNEGNIEQQDIKDAQGVLYQTLQQTFDSYNQLDTRTIIDQVVDYNYAPDGTLQSQADAKNITTEFTYDEVKKLTGVTGDKSGTDLNTQDTLTQYVYDVADRLTQVTAPNGASTGYMYDDLGNLLQETSPDRGTVKYTYDEAGNVKSATDARNITTAYSYDELNRVVNIDYPGVEEDVSFVYDSATECSNSTGRLCKIIDQSGTTIYQYDSFGNLVRQDKTEAGITYTTEYTYDLLGRVEYAVLPTGRQINYRYNSLGQITSVDAVINSSMHTIIHDASYRADGLLQGMEFGNGFVLSNAYNMKGQLTSFNMPALSGQPAPAPQVVATNDESATDLDQGVTIDVLQNDIIENVTLLEVSILTPAAHGEAIVNPDNTVSYLPEQGFLGIDSFVYQVNGDGQLDQASVQVTVNDIDSDGDGLTNSVDTDDDNDGMPDTWEITYGLNPLDAGDASGDLDGDGISNLSEYNMQTDPQLKPGQRYYVLSPKVATGSLFVTSLVDGNTITAGATTLVLNQYQQGVIPVSDLSPGTIITGTGPFDTGSDQASTDMLVPEQFASKQFVIPHFRGSHTYYLLSPDADANVAIDIAGTITNITLTQGVVTTFAAGSNNNISGVITSDQPILVSHVAGGSDAYTVPPAATQLVGVRTGQVAFGAAEDNTTVTVHAQNGESQSYSLNKGEKILAVIGTAAAQGEGDAYHITANKPVAAMQGADSDGAEASAFWSPRHFATRYAFPVGTQYVAVVCLQNASITLTDPVNGVVTKNCNSNTATPGKVYFGSSVNGVNITAGSSLESSAPIYLMYESAATNAERNLLGNDSRILNQTELRFVLNPRVEMGPLTVMSLVDNNTITAGSTTVRLDRYEQATIPASELSQGAVIKGEGPFDTDSNVTVTDMLAPGQFAGKQFVVPHFRGTHTYYLLSPGGNANVTIDIGGAVSNLLLAPGVVTEFAAGSNNAVSGIITSDLPIVVSHVAGYNDAYVVPPATTELVGVRTGAVIFGALENGTTVNIYAHNGAAGSYSLNKGSRLVAPIGTGEPHGLGSAYHMTSNKPIAAIQGADGDGGDASAFWSPQYSASRHAFPEDVQYIVVVCLQNTSIKLTDPVNGVTSQNCSSNGGTPGKAYFGSSVSGNHITAGSILESSAPVYVMFDGGVTNREKNMLGSGVPAVASYDSGTQLAWSSNSTITVTTTKTSSLLALNGTQATADQNKVQQSSAGYIAVSNSAQRDELVEQVSRQLMVVALQSIDSTGYTVYRKGPETGNTWVQTAEDPNSYDRPDRVYYVTADAISVWQNDDNVNRKANHAGSQGAKYHSAAFDMSALLAKLGQDPETWQTQGFIKVSHGTTSSPVSIDSEIWSYVYDANGNVENILTDSGGSAYTYDALNRLIEDTRAGQSTETIDYDRNGNRTASTIDSIVNSYGYVTDSNQLTSNPQGNVTHDAAGNRTSDQGGNRSFEYNNAGRLYKVYEAGQLIATYTYNALGQRTRKVTQTATTVYHYDLAGNLVSETSGAGEPVKDYIYMNSVPVAQIDTDGVNDTVSYLHSDHLGTPRRATNAAGEVVWAWESDAFGKSAANDDADNDSTATIINLRFAGQYYDVETALHYNYFRYYDPSTGRYVTSDPIGLWGGLNTYGYVGGNPLIYTDSVGLAYSPEGEHGLSRWEVMRTPRPCRTEKEIQILAASIVGGLVGCTQGWGGCIKGAIVGGLASDIIGTRNATHGQQEVVRTLVDSAITPNNGPSNITSAIASTAIVNTLPGDSETAKASVAGAFVGGVTAGGIGYTAGAVAPWALDFLVDHFREQNKENCGCQK